MAGQDVRPDADPPLAARRSRRPEDRDAGHEGRAEEGREESLAEYRAALRTVAPVFSDRRAALPTLAASRGLIRLDDDELRLREFLPAGLADEKEREVVGPRLEFEERDPLWDDHVVDAFQEVPRVLEADDLLLVADDELSLSEAELFVEPGHVLHLGRQLERAEPEVHLLEQRIRLESLRHTEPEPVREDLGNSPVRCRTVIGEKCRSA